MTHTENCKALRVQVDALHAETMRAFRRSERIGKQALDREAPVRARLIACHIGDFAECYCTPAERVA